jgi:hypothetical protein
MASGLYNEVHRVIEHQQMLIIEVATLKLLLKNLKNVDS